MRFLDAIEVEEWKRSRGIAAPHVRDSHRDTSRNMFVCKSPEHLSRQFWFSSFIETALRPWSQCILSPEEWGIWESSENWHLYYSLCKFHGENRLIDDVKGLCFFEDEHDDLITFVQVCISMGWDFSVLTENDDNRIFLSHDEWACFSIRFGQHFEEIHRFAERGHLEVTELRKTE